MGRLSKISRTDLHALLWERADRVGRLRINNVHLANELSVDRVTIARIMKEFRDEGRITKIGAGERRVVLYRVADPSEFPSRDSGKQK